MSSSRHERLQAIFEEALALPPEDRAAALDRACAGDASLRDEAERVLADAERPDILDDDAIDRGAHLPAHDDLAGGMPHRAHAGAIEGFRIVRLLGEGGMGAVYEAEQDRPRRRVALKLIRASLVTEIMRRRFGREAEALGRLKHPGIAQIYSVGLGDDASQPYLAMELIEGQPITAYAKAAGLDTRARLELAIQLCDAVEHAHQRGVIHRDLKPANILIDQSGQLKVLDFGIARITEGDVLLTSLRTEPGQIVGTAAYMSPEQASGDPDDVDTRSDVYSLGVVIFELLCGRLPVAVDRLPLPDAIRAIREQEATRIGTIDTRLRGDVETMLAKALDHDKSRRYQTASEFGADLRRFLQDEPIVARPPSAMYQLRKFARRHRVLVSAGCAVVMALMVGLVATAVALRNEGAARLRAEQSLERARGSTLFLDEMFSGLGAEMTDSLDTKLLETMLDNAETDLDEDVTNPVVRADLLAIMGRARHSMWDYEKAVEFFRASDELYTSLGPEYDEDRYEKRLIYADSLKLAGNAEVAEAMLTDAIKRYGSLGDMALCAQATRQLAELRMDTGRWDEALELIEQTKAQAIDAPEPELEKDRIETRLELGKIEMLRGALLRRFTRLDEAKEAYESALEQFDAEEDKLQRVIVLNGLALLARDDGRLEDAEQRFREVLDLRQSIDPRPNPQVAVILSNLGRLLTSLDKLDEAAVVLEKSLQMHKEVYGEDHFTVGYPAVSVGEVYSRQGDHERALELIDRGMTSIESQYGRAHPVYVSMLCRRGDALRRAGRLPETREAYSSCLELIDELPGNHLALAVPARMGLATVLRDIGDTEGAVHTLEELLEEPELTGADAERIRDLLVETRSTSPSGPG